MYSVLQIMSLIGTISLLILGAEFIKYKQKYKKDPITLHLVTWFLVGFSSLTAVALGDQATSTYLMGVATSVLVYFAYLYELTSVKQSDELNSDIKTETELDKYTKDKSYETGWMDESDINSDDWILYEDDIELDLSDL